MIYISVQPDLTSFHWQVEVMLTNFEAVGIEKCHIIFLTNAVSQKALELKEKFPQYQFFFYKDERSDAEKQYPPTAKPYGMLQHFLTNRIKEPIFYHDSDIIFKNKINESRYESDDICYMSDTISYIGYNYVKSKGDDVLFEMCKIVDIDCKTIIENQQSSGGAQYILKNTTPAYWSKVYRDSYRLYSRLSDIEPLWRGEGYPIQKWCAEMWATLWNMWYFKYPTAVCKQLDFVFATAAIEDYEKCNILHNAGVTERDKFKMFFKGDFISRDPFQVDLRFVDSQYCSYEYKKAIDKVVERQKYNEF